ncbi:MAG TPA: RnfH family protein [Candidatus Thiothrix moscowensis]|uniref:RnfH family protein n=1 Tax=unclassified Thiothrix TaxID=2636184 RepID=UPI0025F9563A|nr:MULTISPECIES: RnfH family protein [unclassified Thiothrix]HRJ51713.1 RnfH family protein [Candidatus Thiothrix moscowensis]HRJ92028.1 RnfH family protein [Candidatus Thiothrix moscowensis]
MANSETITIEVVYPLPHEQLLLSVQVPEGASIQDGIVASGVLERYPELKLATLAAGVFGKVSKLDQPLRARDRIEIYRPLIADPKAVRKQRAAEGKRMKKGGGDAADEVDT